MIFYVINMIINGMSDNQSISTQNIMNSHLFEINRLSTIKSSNPDVIKMIKDVISKHKSAYKNFNLSKSETSLVSASKKSITAWEYSNYINEYINNHGM